MHNTCKNICEHVLLL